MRTRFIGADVLQPAPVETLDFLHCAPPHLPPYSASILDGVRNCFDGLSLFDGTPEIEKLPIEAPLTKFFSDVLPQFIVLPAGAFADDASSSCFVIDDSHLENNEILSDKEWTNNPGYDSLQEKDERSCDDAGITGIKFFQFEAPAVNPFSEMIHDELCQRVEEKVFFEISHVESDEDILSLELRMQDFLEIQQSVYSVCTISTEYFQEQKLYCLESSSTTGGKLNSSVKTFPVFEIDEDSLSVFNDISVRDDLESFDSIEWETWVQDHQLPSSDKELLDYKEFDLLGYLSDHCSVECPSLELACSGFIQVIDFINGGEDSDICQTLLFHQGFSLDVLLHQRNIILFEEYQFTGMELYNFVEVLKGSGKMFAIEACDSMFSETMQFRSFNDLVVSNELILVDDSFRSLPVPILSDNKKILSYHSEVEKMLSLLEPESSSTYDGLYLDWHVLEEDKCGKYSSFWELLEEIDTCNIDSTLSMYDDRMYILKFILSSDCLDEPNSGEENEISNILLQHMSVPPISVIGVVSQNVGRDTPKMRATEGFSSEIGPGKTCNSIDPVANLIGNASALNPIASAGRKKYKPSALSVDKNKESNNSEMEELLNFLPVEEHCKRLDEGEECFMEHVQSVPVNVKPEAVYVNKPSSPEIVIVVNTRNFDKEMVISRRSTYQKILALEKGGAQIVERDLDLPVDMVVNAANCLAWYDLKNIGKKASASDEAFSCLSLCVENIATTTLTSLSYAFNSCILIFEGEKNFLDAVVEASDELYAAAASLGIDFQIFCSYSLIMTDEIVLSCIEATMKRSRGLYPVMSDSETLGESFLTAFPSINPLSAHGILSSAAKLGEFLEQPHDCRMNLVQNYKIPDISVALLGLSCKYGEREDSKSGMTDSSSSASYSSDRFHMKSNQSAAKGKFIDDLSSIDMSVDKLTSSLGEPLPLFSDVHLSPPKASGSTNFWMSEISEIEECKNLASDSKLLHRKRNANMMNSSKVSSLSGYQMGEGSISEKRKKKMKPWDDEFFAGKQSADLAAQTHWHEHDKFGNSADDLIGEVIDTDLCETFRKDISTLNSFSFSPREVENDSASRINRATNKSSFGVTNFVTFPTPNDIDYPSDAWISENSSENSSKKVRKNAPYSSLNNCEFRTEQLKGLSHSDELQKTESCYQPMEKIDVDHSSGTPLWNAIHSGGSQQLRESPWTIEFLNRIKEKSRRHQQSLPRGLSPPCFVPSKMRSSASKRKSPSILEYYKYQKDGISEKPADHKRKKQSTKPSLVNKHPKASNSNHPTWTPVDKRSKRTLSFTSKGSGGQSKLVWSDDGSHLFQERFLS